MRKGINEYLTAVAGVLLCATGALAVESAPQPAKSTVVGKVADVSRQPVAGVEVVLFSDDGEEISRSLTDDRGTYSFGCVDAGAYEIQLMPINGFEGQRVKAPVGDSGLAVAWVVDEQQPALASASPTGGACVVSAAVAQAGDAGSTTVSEIAIVETTAAGSGGGVPVAAAVVGGSVLAAGVGVGIAAGVGAFDSDSSPDSPAK